MAKMVGERIKRTEDPRLITGGATYVDDVKIPGMLHVYIVRSPYAHARLISVNTEAARQHPGVWGVFTGEDVRQSCGTVPTAASMPDLKVTKRWPLAVDKVRYVGEGVAAVVAEDLYTARDAADLVEIQYEPLDAVVDPEAAMQKDAPLLFEEWSDNIAFTWKIEGGDIGKAFASADRVVTQRFINQRVAPVAMEGRGVVAHFQPGDQQLTLWSSTQIPHLMKTQVAIMLGMPENRLRVIAPEVGGGFGCKLNVYAEEALCGYLSRTLGRPVKWIELRRENLSNTTHGRDQINDVEFAVRNDGTILGVKCKIIADIGAYHQLLTAAIPTLTGLMICGPYKIGAAVVEVTGVFTNKMSTDAYRGAGRPEATYLLERMMDRVAVELGMDPADLRRKNFPAATEFPYPTAVGLEYDSGNYRQTLDKALEMVGYADFRKKQQELRSQGKLVGLGLSSYVEICALGPSKAMAAGGWESATVRVDPTAKVTVLTGASPHGQGQETSFAQIVCDFLGVEMGDVNVVHGDTAIVQYGIGTFGSRATAVGGTALYMALEKIQKKATRMAAVLLEGDASEVIAEGGNYWLRSHPSRKVTFKDVALEAYLVKKLPADIEPGLEATCFFEPKNFTFPFGTHAVVVEVDSETGQLKIQRYVAADDCGNVINPLLVEGQLHGGIAQGLGQALFEEVRFDENGQLISGSLMDYAVPRAADMPWIESQRTVTPSPVNPLGVKGVGEAGTIASTPAIVNAAVDALSHLGVRHIDTPLKPEKLWRLIKSAQR